MLYSEFLENTKAKDSEYNYNVYKSLEALYMNNDSMTKQDVYKAAKTLINNEPTEEEKAIDNKIKKEIEEAKKDNVYYKSRIDLYMDFLRDEAETLDRPEVIKEYRETIKNYRQAIKRNVNRIKSLKFYFSI